jgi:hypothetical protein
MLKYTTVPTSNILTCKTSIIFFINEGKRLKNSLLCCPVFAPQMVGTANPVVV